MAKNKQKKQVRPVPTRHAMKPADRALIYAVMLEHGIVPIEDPTFDMRRALATLPPEEARAIKRRFRKMWRKLAKQDKKAAASAGLGKDAPSRLDRTTRKRLVLEQLWANKITPMLDRFENPTNPAETVPSASQADNAKT